ncbi:Major facilitator superfamily domain [Propionibacterium ruminifibrarum]|uniref:Major facilitator superfamily domain n=2 Tax=Propionibacterium ruminifibrarum TaxID=1962131 RepID=A0A375I2C6_9ACTN|nr:Major facilitator superfamily domain [Propionibacterium ruminifibrarum]
MVFQDFWSNMTTSPEPNAALQAELAEMAQHGTPVHGTPEKYKVAIGSSVGATVETYDFIGFGTAASLYLNDAFFPAVSPVLGLLASFATLGIGFAVRPIGGILAGHLGDRIGRKPILIASLLLMGGATVAIGCLPTYDTVGILAPILLVIVRIIQGLAFGGEWGGAILMTYEHAPWLHKGFLTGITQAGFPLGLLLSTIAFQLSTHLPGTWAWRVPFLLSAILIAVGIIIRTHVSESPEFEEVKEEGNIEKNPIAASLRNDWQNFFKAMGLRIAETATYAVAITYVLSYVRMHAPQNAGRTLPTLLTAAAIGLFATISWGALSDKIGRRGLYIGLSIVVIAWGFPLFRLLHVDSAGVMLMCMIISYCICQNGMAGIQGAWFSELYPPERRSAGVSLAYQFSAVLSGFTPFFCTALFEALDWKGPALLIVIYGVIGLVSALTTRETWGKERREAVRKHAEEVDAAVAATSGAVN